MGSHEHVPPYAALPPLDSQRIEVLRLLGRLELMDGPTLFQTLYAGRASHTTLKRDLLELYQHRLVWRTTAPPTARSLEQVSSGRTGRVGGRRRYIYGLSDEGRTLLDSLGVEPDARSLAALKSRDPRGRYAAPNTLGHDLQVSFWGASLLRGLCAIPTCHSIFMQVEFVVEERQRIDLMVVARFDPTTPRLEQTRIPWFDGTPLRPGQREVRLALELDMGTESLPVLLRKFVAYRDLHANGIYHQVFGGPVMLVLLVQTARRAGLLATEFRRAWPGGWALVSLPTSHAAFDSERGALWGAYRSLSDGSTVSLLNELHVGADGTLQMRPALAVGASAAQNQH